MDLLQIGSDPDPPKKEKQNRIQNLIDAIVDALYKSDNIQVIGDGCSSTYRDKFILYKIIEPVISANY